MSVQLAFDDFPTQPTPVARAVPLREALDGLAASWSVRLGYTVVVTGGEWAGWTIGPVKDA